MALYEYQCESCGRRTEALQRMSDPPLTLCPHCGGALRKLFSAPSFKLKGSGWYATDYAKKSTGEPAKSESAGGDEKGAKPAAESTAPASPAKESSSSESSSPVSGGGSGGNSVTKSSSTSKPD